MAKTRNAAAAAKTPEPDDDGWIRWSIQLPHELMWRLKIRAAQEQRPIRATLCDAFEAYLATPAKVRDGAR
jgi:plasmid stability protein